MSWMIRKKIGDWEEKGSRFGMSNIHFFNLVDLATLHGWNSEEYLRSDQEKPIGNFFIRDVDGFREAVLKGVKNCSLVAEENPELSAGPQVVTIDQLDENSFLDIIAESMRGPDLDPDAKKVMQAVGQNKGVMAMYTRFCEWVKDYEGDFIYAIN